MPPRKRPTAPKTETPVLRSLEPPTTDTAAPSNPEERIERLSIALTPDGNAIDWERMRPATRDKLKTLTGMGATTTAPAEAIDPAVIGMLYGSIGSLMVAAARARGFTAEQSSVLIFTAEEKFALVEPTSKVLSKYTGSLGKWQDEILLAVTLGTVLTAKVSALRKPATVIAMVPDAPDAAPDTDGVS